MKHDEEVVMETVGPDGQILGPMNMIHIIEGIAEGVILETARICEVGAQEWVPLDQKHKRLPVHMGREVEAIPIIWTTKRPK